MNETSVHHSSLIVHRLRFPRVGRRFARAAPRARLPLPRHRTMVCARPVAIARVLGRADDRGRQGGDPDRSVRTLASGRGHVVSKSPAERLGNDRAGDRLRGIGIDREPPPADRRRADPQNPTRPGYRHASRAARHLFHGERWRLPCGGRASHRPLRSPR